MSFSSAINWLIRNQAEMEMNMNSVERTSGELRGGEEEEEKELQ